MSRQRVGRLLSNGINFLTKKLAPTEVKLPTGNRTRITQEVEQLLSEVPKEVKQPLSKAPKAKNPQEVKQFSSEVSELALKGKNSKPKLEAPSAPPRITKPNLPGGLISMGTRQKGPGSAFFAAISSVMSDMARSFSTSSSASGSSEDDEPKSPEKVEKTDKEFFDNIVMPLSSYIDQEGTPEWIYDKFVNEFDSTEFTQRQKDLLLKVIAENPFSRTENKSRWNGGLLTQEMVRMLINNGAKIPNFKTALGYFGRDIIDFDILINHGYLDAIEKPYLRALAPNFYQEILLRKRGNFDQIKRYTEYLFEKGCLRPGDDTTKVAAVNIFNSLIFNQDRKLWSILTPENMEFLTSNGFDLNATSPNNGMSIVTCMAAFDLHEELEKFAELNPNIDLLKPDATGESALTIACKLGRRKIAELILEKCKQKNLDTDRIILEHFPKSMPNREETARILSEDLGISSGRPSGSLGNNFKLATGVDSGVISTRDNLPELQKMAAITIEKLSNMIAETKDPTKKEILTSFQNDVLEHAIQQLGISPERSELDICLEQREEIMKLRQHALKREADWQTAGRKNSGKPKGVTLYPKDNQLSWLGDEYRGLGKLEDRLRRMPSERVNLQGRRDFEKLVKETEKASEKI